MKTKILQKILLGLSLFGLMSVLLVGCSKDEGAGEDPNSDDTSADVYILDDIVYDINLSYLSFGTIPLPDAASVNMGLFVITGGHEGKITTLNLPVIYAQGQDIQGTYNGRNALATPGSLLGNASYSFQEGGNISTGAMSRGTVEVRHHQGNEYTLEFNLEFEGGKKATGKVRGHFLNLVPNGMRTVLESTFRT